MPSLGISVAEGTIVEWRKSVGEDVAYEEPICDISTDKIESELPAPEAGRLVEILVDVGETVDAGTPIAVIAVDRPASVPAPIDPAALDGAAVEPDEQPAERGSGRESLYSPVVSRLAAEHDIDLKTIRGTGRDGRVRKQDVLAAIESNGRPHRTAYEPPAPVSLSRLRQAIGENTKRSLDTAATVTSWIDVDFSRVELVRRRLGTTALPVVGAATVATLADFPDLNAWLDVHDYIRHETVNLGIAVAIGAAGVLVPVIREAEQLDVVELSRRIRDLATRARSGDLVPDDMRDGTFTLTNPGQFGTMMATPVIIQPQVAILDVEAIVRRPTVVVDPSGEERIAIAPMCVLGLSWDHRALDGVLAAQFLGALRKRLESLEEPA